MSDGIGEFARTSVGSLVPVGFEAYARVLEPVESIDEQGYERWVRWEDIARATGAVVHPAMELAAIMALAPKGFLRTNPPATASFVPPWEVQLAKLAEVLGRHTQTRDDCWFAFWEGNTAFDGIRADVPELEIGSSRYYRLRGPVSRAVDTFRGLSANL